MSTTNSLPKSLQVTPSQGCAVHNEFCPFSEELSRCRLELATLQELVRLDELTGLFNYRHFLYSIEAVLDRVRRSGLSLSLIMLDIDHFKKLNDCWGHEAGNVALKALGRAVQATVRRTDIPCRYGGEEFAIILPDTSLTAAINLAEHIRTIIEALSITVNESAVSVTASFGVGTFTANEMVDATGFVTGVDTLLYDAKRAGRNCVRHAPNRLETHVSNEERDFLFAK